MRRGLWFVCSALLLTAGCPDSDPQPDEAKQIGYAAGMAGGAVIARWPRAGAAAPVVLYVDRSQSMRGFLDPDYNARIPTDYRAVLDGFDARLRPARVYGFGNEVRQTERPGLGVLGDPGFYADANTEMERVFPLIEGDSLFAASHIIIGDGRRTNPNVANEQFVRMRRVAEAWIARGGTFVAAASAAPFRPVEDDPATCRPGSQGGDSTCPLYAFAFVAPGAEGRVAAALAEVFQHLYVAPFPGLGPGDAGMIRANEADMMLEPTWSKARDGTPIARLRANAATNRPLHARLAMRDTVSRAGRAVWAALRGRRLVPQLSVRTLAEDTAASPWRASSSKGSLLRATPDPLVYELFSYGPQAPANLYRIELHAAGEPSWLDAFDAENARDAVRTYGLGRLFEGFRADDPSASPPVARAYVVVN